MKNKNYFIFLVVILASIITFSAGNCFMADIFKNDFEKNWEDLSRDVKKLNDYTASRPVHLRNKKVEGLDLEGVVFSQATFEGVEWIDVNVRNATLTNVVFKNCKFSGGKWSEGIFADVVFENCEFVDTTLGRSSMDNVIFRNCKIIQAGIGYLTGGKVEFDGCHWDTGVAGDSSIEFILRNSKFEGVSFSMMKGSVPILIENSILEEVDFSRGHFSTIVLRRAKQGESPVRFNQASAKSITFEDVDMVRGVSLASVQAANVRISNSRMRVSFARSVIPKVSARDSEFFVFGLSEANMPHVTIVNSRIHYLSLWDGSAEEMIIQDSEINQIEGENFKGNHILWHNVTLDGEVNLTNAQVKDFRPTRLKRGPNLNLITTGSNLRFDFSAE